MDISKELASIRASKGDKEYVITNLEAQKEDLNKRIHLLKAVNAALGLENLINDGLFNECGADFIWIKYSSEYNGELGHCYNLGFTLRDKHSNIVPFSQCIDINRKLEDLFKPFEGFNLNHISAEFRSSYVIEVNIKSNIEKNVLNLLLSDELKTILSYNNMQNSLDSKDVNNVVRKPKI